MWEGIVEPAGQDPNDYTAQALCMLDKVRNKLKTVYFTLEVATKAQKGSSDTALLFYLTSAL
jgi:hypothetical protein